MSPLLTPVPVGSFLVLMLAMELKHYFADFILQTTWMAQGKERVRGWQVPLAVHAAIHGLGTLGIALAVEPALWWLGPVDVAVHGTVNRGKALVVHRHHFDVTNPRFWWLVGFDQLLHQITSVVFVARLALP